MTATTPGQEAAALRLDSLINFRDVAGEGAGHPVAGGGRVQPGRLYRCNRMTPDDDDLATLATLGLTTVYDLRGTPEVEETPDRLPDGVGYVHLPLMSGDLTHVFESLTGPEQAEALMHRIYRSFATGEAERQVFATLLRALATTEGPQVYHCTAGKDRTGWVSYLLLTLAGVDHETVVADYLVSNHRTAEWVEAVLGFVAMQDGDAKAAILAPILAADLSYLEAGIAALTETWGSVDGYLRDGLGLDDDVLEALRALLVA